MEFEKVFRRKLWALVINKKGSMVFCKVKTGLLTLVCVRLIKLLTYNSSSIWVSFCLSFVPAKLTVSLNICVLRLFVFFFISSFYVFCLV